jgi:hypothetical protein
MVLFRRHLAHALRYLEAAYGHYRERSSRVNLETFGSPSWERFRNELEVEFGYPFTT